jgi:hypothetical protein
MRAKIRERKPPCYFLHTLREHLSLPSVVGEVHVSPFFLVFCVVLLWFNRLRPVSCVPNVASVSRLFFIG